MINTRLDTCDPQGLGNQCALRFEEQRTSGPVLKKNSSVTVSKKPNRPPPSSVTQKNG